LLLHVLGRGGGKKKGAEGVETPCVGRGGGRVSESEHFTKGKKKTCVLFWGGEKGKTKNRDNSGPWNGGGGRGEKKGPPLVDHHILRIIYIVRDFTGD